MGDRNIGMMQSPYALTRAFSPLTCWPLVLTDESLLPDEAVVVVSFWRSLRYIWLSWLPVASFLGQYLLLTWFLWNG